MTTTTQRKVDEANERLRWIREDRLTWPPLPSAEHLAAPFVGGVIRMLDVFEGRARALEFDLEQAIDQVPDRDESQDYVIGMAAEMVATVERVCTIVRSTIDSCLYGDNKTNPLNMDSILRGLADTRYVESVLTRRATDDLCKLYSYDENVTPATTEG